MHSNSSDDELWQLARAGDEEAFLAFFRRRQGAIYRFSLRMSGSESIAEDVTQEVFLTLLRGDGRFDAAQGSITSYLYGIARNQILKRIEKDRVLVPVGNGQADEDASEDPLESLASNSDPLLDLTRQELVSSVRQAVLGLPAHYREVVVLCDLEEMSYADAAQALGCAVGTVRSRLHRARALLIDRLRDQKSGVAGAARTMHGYI